MRKVKILYISHSSYLFGAENCLLSLVSGLPGDRFSTTVIVPAEGPLKQKLDELGIGNHVLPLEWWVKNEGRLLHTRGEIPLALDKLLRIIDEEKPDLIHSNTSVVCWGAIAAALAGIRHIWHIHEILDGHPSLEPLIPLPLIFEAMDFLSEKVVVVSNAVKDGLSEFVSSDKLQIIHNGVEFHEAVPPLSLRNELKAAPGQCVVLTVTSLQKHKGIENWLSAAARVIEANSDIHFALAGTGAPELVAALRESITRMNLEGKVHYLGFRKDVPQLLADADLFVLPSSLDAFPLVVLEAMSHGKPVVATDCGGPAEMISDGETGFLVPIEDPDFLATRILEIAGDRVRREKMGHAAQKCYAGAFTIQHYVAHFSSLYEDLLSAEKPRLTSRQTSLLNSIVTAYVDYLKTMRVIPGVEQELALQKRQFLEVNELLAQKQEALLVSEREKTSETQRLAENILSLVAGIETNSQEQSRQSMAESSLRSELEALLAAKSIELADLHDRLKKLEVESACARELQSELEKYLDFRSSEIESRDERIRRLKDGMGRDRELRVQLEGKFQQKVVELTDRDLRAKQIEAELVKEGQHIEEEMRRKEDVLRSLDDNLQKVSAQLRAAEAEISALRSEKAASVRQFEQQLEAREQRVSDLLSSKSWKITAPLRAILDLSKKDK
jgi:glycosyltransferase involved in cell wall biosynthesis